jgi:hypothetical protein
MNEKENAAEEANHQAQIVPQEGSRLHRLRQVDRSGKVGNRGVLGEERGQDRASRAVRPENQLQVRRDHHLVDGELLINVKFVEYDW